MNIVGLPPANTGSTISRRADRIERLDETRLRIGFLQPLHQRILERGEERQHAFLRRRRRRSDWWRRSRSFRRAPRRRSAAAPRARRNPPPPRTTTSPNVAASANDITRALELFLAQLQSFCGCPVPTATSFPCFRKPAASVCPTGPDPMTPIFMAFSPAFVFDFGASVRSPQALSRQTPAIRVLRFFIAVYRYVRSFSW